MTAIRNSQALDLEKLPVLPVDEFRKEMLDAAGRGAHLSAFFLHQQRLIAALSRPESGHVELLSGQVGKSYPALTPDCPQAHWFEREIFEESGVRPEGHPWLKPIRSQPADFFRVEGEEIHEVAVGPVHAGVIEPGHFRFQCHGERVLHLEIALGYQHRGAEKMLVGGPDRRAIHIMETLAGDTSVGHAAAYAQNIEALGGTRVSARAWALRGAALELERLANHVGDLGALANDVGYLPTASFCGRIRGDFLNMTALLCGSRFGRGMIRPGGVGFDAEPGRIQELLERLDRALRDSREAVELLWNSPSVMARFENTGAISRGDCLKLGLVGPAARACGVMRDVRRDFPNGIYETVKMPVPTATTGDVFARAWVRWLEIERSADFVGQVLRSLPQGAVKSPCGKLAPNAAAVSLVEGWRGEICHVAVTDRQGRFSSYKIVDPSFHNWFGLSLALRGQQISDFPLCNKSFNLSYCGHDL